jgi:hypothetical protein
MRTLTLLLLIPLCAACALDAEQPPTASLTQAQALAAPPSPALLGPPAQADEADLKRPDRVPRVERAKVDWAAALAAPQLDAAWFSEAQRAKIARSPVPLLWPADEALVRGAHVSVGPRWAAWHVQADGVTVRMHATDALVELPELVLHEVGEAMAKRPYLITRTHQIVTVTFNRFGAGYALDVECARPMDDVRCTQDTFVSGLMERLAVAPRGGVQ